jgi:hypothetical protein
MFGIDQLLWQIAISAPLLIVWIIGIVLSVATWRKHPQVSLLAFVGFAIQLFQSSGGILFYYYWLTTQPGVFGMSSQQFGMVFSIVNFAQICLSAVAWALVLFAIFRWRNPSNRILGHDGQYLPEGFALDATKTVQRGDGDVFYRAHP